MTEVEWARLKAHELRALAAADAVVILPVAAIEQHGPHLPVMVDTRLGLEVACRAARKAQARRPVVVLPPVVVGLSEHHMPFGGTLTLDIETFFAVLRCLCRSVARHGFRDVLIANSHGGNVRAAEVAADTLGPELGLTVVAAGYAREAAAAFAAILEDQPGIHHACEAETSMMLALEPGLVDVSDLAALKTERAAGALQAGRAAYRWRGFAHITGNGVSGDPTRASAEKGERLLEAGADALAELILDPDTFGPARDLRGAPPGGVPFRDR